MLLFGNLLIGIVDILGSGNFDIDFQFASSWNSHDLVALDALNFGLSVREALFNLLALVASEVEEVRVGGWDGSSEFVRFEFLIVRYVE